MHHLSMIKSGLKLGWLPNECRSLTPARHDNHPDICCWIFHLQYSWKETNAPWAYTIARESPSFWCPFALAISMGITHIPLKWHNWRVSRPIFRYATLESSTELRKMPFSSVIKTVLLQFAWPFPCSLCIKVYLLHSLLGSILSRQ